MDTLIGGRYRILAELGRGGMAVVHRVQDTRTGAVLALKRGVALDEKGLRKRSRLRRQDITKTPLVARNP